MTKHKTPEIVPRDNAKRDAIAAYLRELADIVEGEDCQILGYACVIFCKERGTGSTNSRAGWDSEWPVAVLAEATKLEIMRHTAIDSAEKLVEGVLGHD